MASEDCPTMTERLGDHRRPQLLRRHKATVREQVAAHRGFEFKSDALFRRGGLRPPR